MSEIRDEDVEAVARALFDAQFNKGRTPQPFPWDMDQEHVKEDFRGYARAAILAWNARKGADAEAEARSLASLHKDSLRTMEADIDFLLGQIEEAQEPQRVRDAVRSFRKQLLQVGHGWAWAALAPKAGEG